MKLNNSRWDAVVVGAGVAGGVAAAILAQRGHKTLLVEKSSWPREKVCGGCLSALAVGVLEEVGLGAAVRGATPIRSVSWHAARKTLQIQTPGEVGLLRAELDARIVAEAVRRGCEFVPGASATLLEDSGEEPFRSVRIRRGDEITTVRAGVVLACDGIGGTVLAGEPWAKWRVGRDSWIGVGATCPGGPWEIERGGIHMHVGNSGYAGMVRMDEGLVHIAAALDPAVCRKVGGPQMLVRQILAESAGRIAPGWQMPRIRGTPALTRRRDRLGGRRVLAIGDACGYVEPFTGEGMAWAAIGAREVVNLLPAAGEAWPSDLAWPWRRRYQEVIGRKQFYCRAMRPLMRSAGMAPMIIGAANLLPGVVNWIAGQVSQPRSRQKEIVNDAHVVIHSA